MHDDYQLNLVENYLLKLKYANDMKRKNNSDFGFLLQTFALDNRKEHANSSSLISRSRDGVSKEESKG
jgi:hypothetical protein